MIDIAEQFALFDTHAATPLRAMQTRERRLEVRQLPREARAPYAGDARFDFSSFAPRWWQSEATEATVRPE